MSECDRERMEQLTAVAFCRSYTLRPLCYQCEDARPLGLPTEPVKFTHTPLSERRVCP